MVLVLLVVVVAVVIYLIAKSLTRPRLPVYAPPPQFSRYEPPIYVEPEYPGVVENPLIDIAAVAATEIAVESVLDREPGPFQGYGGGFDSGPDQGFDPDFTNDGDSFDSGSDGFDSSGMDGF